MLCMFMESFQCYHYSVFFLSFFFFLVTCHSLSFLMIYDVQNLFTIQLYQYRVTISSFDYIICQRKSVLMLLVLAEFSSQDSSVVRRM